MLGLLLGNLWRQWRAELAKPIRLARLQRKYPGCRFYPNASVDGGSTLGKHCVIFQNTVICNSVIGDHTFVQKDSFVSRATIGKFCSIAMRVTIGPGRHPTTAVSSHPAFYSVTQPIARTFSSSDTYTPFEPISIGHDVWIGQNAIVMDGIRIGTGAVVAAGAIVTHDVPDYAIVAGVPGRVVKYRFEDGIRERLLQSEWWNMPDEWLQSYCRSFMDPAEFLARWEKEQGRQ